MNQAAWWTVSQATVNPSRKHRDRAILKALLDDCTSAQNSSRFNLMSGASLAAEVFSTGVSPNGSQTNTKTSFSRTVLGESPCWSPRASRLLMIDIRAKRLISIDGATGAVSRSWHTTEMPGCVVLAVDQSSETLGTPGSGLVPGADADAVVVATESGLWRVDERDSRGLVERVEFSVGERDGGDDDGSNDLVSLSLFSARPDADAHPGNRFNDGKVDPVGRLWAGTMETVECVLLPCGSLEPRRFHMCPCFEAVTYTRSPLSAC
jgi:sugar lactone lactonase YvrE